jgi:apolipoprotein N-acyltransferase
MMVLVAGACGPILRGRKSLWLLVAIPILWSGLDYLRHDLAGFTVNRLSLSLSLAHAIPPSTPIAQAAATVGIHGLAFLVVATNTLVFLALRERGLARRIVAAAAALVVPAGLHFAGAAGLPAESSAGPLAVAPAAGIARSLDEVVRLVEPMEVHGSALLLLPPVVEEFAIGAARPLLAGLAARKRAFVLAASSQSDGAVAVWLIDPAGGLVERPSSRLLPLEAGTVGVGTGGDFHRPDHARRLSRDGATLLALLDDRAGGGTRGEALRSTVQAYRAVENRRWLVKAGPGGAFIADPYGRVVARVAPGIAGAVLDGVDFLEARSVYTRAGGWIEGLLAAGAAAVLLASAIAGLSARSRGGPRAASPAGPASR